MSATTTTTTTTLLSSSSSSSSSVSSGGGGTPTITSSTTVMMSASNNNNNNRIDVQKREKRRRSSRPSRRRRQRRPLLLLPLLWSFKRTQRCDGIGRSNSSCSGCGCDCGCGSTTSTTTKTSSILLLDLLVVMVMMMMTLVVTALFLNGGVGVNGGHELGGGGGGRQQQKQQPTTSTTLPFPRMVKALVWPPSPSRPIAATSGSGVHVMLGGHVQSGGGVCTSSRIIMDMTAKPEDDEKDEDGHQGNDDDDKVGMKAVTTLPKLLDRVNGDNSSSNTDNNDNNNNNHNEGGKSSSTSTSTLSSVQFGDAVRLDDRPKTDNDDDMMMNDSSLPLTLSSSSTSTSTTTTDDPNKDHGEEEFLQQRQKRNVGVAIVSVVLAVLNYVWQWTHPVTPIQLLFSMQQSSSPITVIGNTDKPTVVDFWAPWCENCKYMAPTLYQLEETYKDKVNFVSINADNLEENWSLIEAFGVDAIPHLALVEADGTVDTALIGIVPKEWLTGDLDTLIENAAAASRPKSFLSSSSTASYKPLPFQMLDVFANRSPEQRKVHVEQETVSTPGDDAVQEGASSSGDSR